MAHSLATSFQEAFNRILFNSQALVPMADTGIYLNYTLLGDPIFKKDYLAIPFDGTFFIPGMPLEYHKRLDDMPIYLNQGRSL